MSDSTLQSDPPSGADVEDDPLAGTPYRFVARVGEGGMGEVVEAEHLTLGNRVAVKLLRKEHFTRYELKDRMRLEAQTCARIRHQNLVWVMDFGETESGRAFVVMELLQGRSLGDELRERGALVAAEAIDMVCQALAGLGAVHAAGVVHRDIKPDNLFLCDREDDVRCVKVLDFGIAKIVDAGRDPRTPLPLMQPTAEGMTVGTPRYASPEQSRAERDIDARSDLYSLGWVLYRMLTGREPFADRTSQNELWRAHENETPQPPSAVAVHPVPRELDEIVMRAIAKRREHRFPSAEAFRAALLGVAARTTASPPQASVAMAARALRGTEIIDPTASAALRGGAPVSMSRSATGLHAAAATVHLGPASGMLAPATAKTIDLGASALAPGSARATTAAPISGATIAAPNDAATRRVLPWEREAPAATRRRMSPVVPFVVLGALGLAMVVVLWQLGVW